MLFEKVAHSLPDFSDSRLHMDHPIDQFRFALLQLVSNHIHQFKDLALPRRDSVGPKRLDWHEEMKASLQWLDGYP